jgi:hypothetical protein
LSRRLSYRGISKRGETPEKDTDGQKFDGPPLSAQGFFVFQVAHPQQGRRSSGMRKKGAQEVQRRIEKKGRSVLWSLTLDNPMAAAELRHQCEEGRVPVSVLIELLNIGYPPELNDKAIEGGGIDWIGEDGHPLPRPLLENTAKTLRTRQDIARTLTLDNPMVVMWVRRQWEGKTMRPALRLWFIRNGYQRLAVRKMKRRLPFIGVPWRHDPMAQQEAEAIAAQEAQNKAEELARPAQEQEPKGPVTGEQEAEGPEELEVYREKGDRG